MTPASRRGGGKTVSAAVVRQIARLAERHGIGPADFATLTGVRAAELSQPLGRIDALRYRRVRAVLRQCLLESPRVEPMVRDAATQLQAFPGPASLWFNSRSLGDALLGFARYRSVIGQPDALDLQTDGDAVRIVYMPDDPGDLGLCSAIANFAILESIVDYYGADAERDGCMAGRVGAEIQLPQRSSRIARRAEELLGMKVGSADSYRFLVSGANLWRPVRHFHPVLHQHERGLLDQALAELQASEAPEAPVASLADRVRLEIEDIWQEGTAIGSPGGLIALASERLAVSRWTLRRRLLAEGRTFQDFVSALRADRARQMLAEPGLSMLEISVRLGFESQGSFSRFFRSRCGVSPGEFRAELQGVAAIRPPPRAR